MSFPGLSFSNLFLDILFSVVFLFPHMKDQPHYLCTKHYHTKIVIVDITFVMWIYIENIHFRMVKYISAKNSPKKSPKRHTVSPMHAML